MKTKQFIPLFLVVSAAMFSCSKEAKAPQDAEIPDVVVTEGNFSLTASTDAVTKTELGSDFFIYWKSGDALSVWEEGSSANNNVRFDLTATSVGERIGTFTGTLTAGSDPFKLYAVYPYKDSYASDPSALTLSLPTQVSQVSDVNGVVGASDFMFGSATFSSSDENYSMRFRYPLALLDIVVDGTGSCLSGAIAESVTITANKAFVGDATVNLTTGALEPADVDAGKQLVIDFPATANISTAQHAWVAIYPVDLTNADCCFDLKMTNGQEIKFNVNPKKAFQEQKIYTINLTNIDKHVDDGKAQPIFFDLVGANSSKGYSLNRANCYMVSEGGYYKFAAQKIDKTNVFTGSKPYTDGYSAKWLWATSNESKVDFVSLGNSGAVNFRAPANANGSTVLAVLDPDGNIVWSWHIWCTGDESIMEPHHWSRGNTWLVSDINLGAKGKTGTDAYGLYYQWGRKDPFPGNPNTCVFNDGVSIVGLSSKNAAVTPDAVGYAIAHPTTILYQNDYRTWISTADQANNAQSLWNNTTTRGNKTNYDPCPAGYCMIPHPDYAWYTHFIDSNIVYGSGGMTYTYDGVSTFYPAAGYLNGLNLTDAGATVRVWTASLTTTPSATANMLGYSLLGTLSTSSKKNNEGSRAGFGLPVRCMKI